MIRDLWTGIDDLRFHTLTSNTLIADGLEDTKHADDKYPPHLSCRAAAGWDLVLTVPPVVLSSQHFCARCIWAMIKPWRGNITGRGQRCSQRAVRSHWRLQQSLALLHPGEMNNRLSVCRKAFMNADLRTMESLAHADFQCHQYHATGRRFLVMTMWSCFEQRTTHRPVVNIHL